jgi:thiamine phosphate synthase YjbQ (UPF0047 family)
MSNFQLNEQTRTEILSLANRVYLSHVGGKQIIDGHCLIFTRHPFAPRLYLEARPELPSEIRIAIRALIKKKMNIDCWDYVGKKSNHAPDPSTPAVGVQ